MLHALIFLGELPMRLVEEKEGKRTKDKEKYWQEGHNLKLMAKVSEYLKRTRDFQKVPPH